MELFNVGDVVKYGVNGICRVSDITLCDFWGYSASSFKMTGFSKGVSCIITNTEKGDALLDKIKNGLVISTDTMEKAKRGNLCLSSPFPAPENVDAFFLDLKNFLMYNGIITKNFKKIKELYERIQKNYI